jgi:hypothetical protein
MDPIVLAILIILIIIITSILYYYWYFKGSCQDQSDCVNTLCQHGKCVSCTSDEQCGSNSICCGIKDSCPSGTCAPGKRCSTTDDCAKYCPKNFVCTNNMCNCTQ